MSVVLSGITGMISLYRLISTWLVLNLIRSKNAQESANLSLRDLLLSSKPNAVEITCNMIAPSLIVIYLVALTRIEISRQSRTLLYL